MSPGARSPWPCLPAECGVQRHPVVAVASMKSALQSFSWVQPRCKAAARRRKTALEHRLHHQSAGTHRRSGRSGWYVVVLAVACSLRCRQKYFPQPHSVAWLRLAVCPQNLLAVRLFKLVLNLTPQNQFQIVSGLAARPVRSLSGDQSALCENCVRATCSGCCAVA